MINPETLERVFNKIFTTAERPNSSPVKGPSPQRSVPLLRVIRPEKPSNETVVTWPERSLVEKRLDGEDPQIYQAGEQTDSDSDDSLVRGQRSQAAEAELRRQQLQKAHRDYLEFLRSMQSGTDVAATPYQPVSSPVQEELSLPPRPQPPPLIQNHKAESPLPTPFPSPSPKIVDLQPQTPTPVKSPKPSPAAMTQLEKEIQAIKSNPHLTAVEQSRQLKAVLAEYLKQKNVDTTKATSPLPTKDDKKSLDHTELWRTGPTPIPAVAVEPPNLRPAAPPVHHHQSQGNSPKQSTTVHRPASPPVEPSAQPSLRGRRRQWEQDASPEQEASTLLSPVHAGPAPNPHAASPQPSSLQNTHISQISHSQLTSFLSDIGENLEEMDDISQPHFTDEGDDVSSGEDELVWHTVPPENTHSALAHRPLTLGEVLAKQQKPRPQANPPLVALHPNARRTARQRNEAELRIQQPANRPVVKSTVAESVAPSVTTNSSSISMELPIGIVSQYRNSLHTRQAIVTDDASSVNSFSADANVPVPDDWFSPQLEPAYISPHPSEPLPLFDPLPIKQMSMGAFDLPTGTGSLADHASAVLDYSLGSDSRQFPPSPSRSSGSSMDYLGDQFDGESEQPDWPAKPQWLPREDLDDDFAFGGPNTLAPYDLTTQAARELMLLSPVNASRSHYRPPGHLLASFAADELTGYDSD